MNKNLNTKDVLLNSAKNYPKSSIGTILLDFDGTITKKDSVASFFMEFAEENWLEIENDWLNDRISSIECMILQLDTIKHLTEEKLYNFLNSIKIQDGFVEFCTLAQKQNKTISILSDGFDFFISYILKKEKLSHIKFFANHLEILNKNDCLKFNLTFPNENKNCISGLGSCKCTIAKTITKNENFIYAGDGLSDRCIASKAHLLFAKNSLKKHCLKSNIEFVEFEDFFQISNYLFKEGTTEDARFETKGKEGAYRA